jgi:hypothetical protein
MFLGCELPDPDFRRVPGRVGRMLRNAQRSGEGRHAPRRRREGYAPVPGSRSGSRPGSTAGQAPSTAAPGRGPESSGPCGTGRPTPLPSASAPPDVDRSGRAGLTRSSLDLSLSVLPKAVLLIGGVTVPAMGSRPDRANLGVQTTPGSRPAKPAKAFRRSVRRLLQVLPSSDPVVPGPGLVRIEPTMRSAQGRTATRSLGGKSFAIFAEFAKSFPERSPTGFCE